MVVGIGFVQLHIEESRSLKEKRSVVRKIIGRARNNFNASIAEVGDLDSWTRCVIGFSMVGNDRSFINSKMDKLLTFIENLHLADVTHSQIEINSISDVLDS